VAAGVTPDLGGTLRVRFADQANLASMLGTTFDFFDWPAVLDINNRFDAIELPPGTQWDLNQLYVSGTAKLTRSRSHRQSCLRVWATDWGAPASLSYTDGLWLAAYPVAADDKVEIELDARLPGHNQKKEQEETEKQRGIVRVFCHFMSSPFSRDSLKFLTPRFNQCRRGRNPIRCDATKLCPRLTETMAVDDPMCGATIAKG
jgi:hypothetical protein